MTPRFEGGRNIAMKLPKARFDAVVAFYRDVLGMTVTDESDADVAAGVAQCASVAFGPVTLWLDRVDNYTGAELWLELCTDDVDAAMAHLAAHGVSPQDELEALPPGSDGHWISNPVMIPHLVRRPD
ncbi:Glyoxalase/Bleomycin resistance protein/Dioxygenase superfamily protein [Glycomyces sambucus]|uniref:Glyoxalase/Bleomycin resistance protein/Dioxygenase superfamily protein n=1 Tax=Glycomyces sambucus TaxID=380244 RepID=A0A1G9DES5_9ACTN|nr:VOC family protein [Glycomyces sambucus]SDK62385.1 Glyoxalase/Bleomycin resistance protein/Dioxygenase superfamily protein [Glycomyces sambucus]